ncbi:MAG: NADPH-dependent glutamate synthase [Actinomycetes bacterium]
MTDISNKERMAIDRQPMPTRPADERAHTFDEVNTGLGHDEALVEALRCLQCKRAWCVDACPVHVDIPLFLDQLADDDLVGAARSLLSDNALPCVTGRVCPQETQCEGACPRGKRGQPVAIGHLERYVADWAAEHADLVEDASTITPTGRSVAVVGSGPGGLTAAGELARRGHAVTVFEAFHVAGGVLGYGIPPFRLPRDVTANEVARLERLGVVVQTNAVVGRTYDLDELRADFDAVFLAVGAGLPVFLDIPGENLKGVYSANEYLTRVNLMGAFRPEADTPVAHGQRVAVVGGGNVAMDAVRTARRLGAAEVVIVYRRTREELPARAEEVGHAEEEGVRFDFLVAPLEVLGDGDGWVRGLRCQRMELGEPDASGRRRPVPVDGSEFELPCDLVVEAVGTRANPLLTHSAPGLDLDDRGFIAVDDDGRTSLPGVFAGGDIVRGSATVILAMGDGKRAAAAIDQHLLALSPT